MNINIICPGKIKEDFFRKAMAEYEKRLSRFCRFSVTEVKDEKIPENASEKEMLAVLEKEGNSILSKIPKNSYVIAMCIEAKEVSSSDLAKKMRDISMLSGSITFIIGGSLGLSEQVKRSADLCISFGKITLPHQLIRVVLSEQIYRSFKINSGENYHK